MEKIIELVYCGSTTINDIDLLSGMKEISESLKLNIIELFNPAFVELEKSEETVLQEFMETMDSSKLLRNIGGRNVATSSSSKRRTEVKKNVVSSLDSDDVMEISADDEIIPAKDLPEIAFPLKCQLCDRGFTVAAALKSHEAKHRKSSLKEGFVTDKERMMDERLEGDLPNHQRVDGSKSISDIKIESIKRLSADNLIGFGVELFHKSINQESNLMANEASKEPLNSARKSVEEDCLTTVLANPEQSAIISQSLSDDFLSERINPEEDTLPLSPELINDVTSSLQTDNVIMEVQESALEESSDAEFKCNLCSYKTSFKNNLKKHLGNVHYREKIAGLYGSFNKECSVCSKALPNKKSWMSHLILGHKAVEQVMPECIFSKIFLTTSKSSTEEQNSEKCSNPNKAFPKANSISKPTLDNKKEKHSSPEILIEKTSTRFQCHLCIKKCITYSDILSHYSIMHFKEELKALFSKKGKNVCGKCNQKCSNENILLRHILMQHEPLTGLIPEREALEITSSAKQEDKNSDNVTLSKGYTMPSNSSSLDLSSTAFQCRICHKESHSHAKLLSHYTTAHYLDKLKPHFCKETQTCNLCKKAFQKKHQLLYHIAYTHKVLAGLVLNKEDGLVKTSSETVPLETRSICKPKVIHKKKSESKNIECFKCKKAFSQYSKLLNHLAIKHFRENLTETYQKETNQCNRCHHVCSDANNFLIHVTNRHGALKDLIPSKSDVTIETDTSTTDAKSSWQCSICEMSVANHHRLLRHIASVHFKEDLSEKYILNGNKCLICDYSTKYISDLYGHLASKHHLLKNLVPGL